MRLLVTSGTFTSPRSRRVTQAKAAARHQVAMVGMRASCQPMPVLMIVAPAASTAGQLDDLVPAAAALDQVEHRQPVDEDEVRSDRLAHAPHDLDREPHAVLRRCRPRRRAPVGARRDELVDEVALGAHHLDAVVAGLAGERGAAREGRDLPADAEAGQAARREGRDRRLEREGATDSGW
jgi:hypothetical protein